MYSNSKHLPPSTHIYSLGFDGCVDTLSSEDNLLNQVLNDFMENPSCHDIIICLGSIRQSVYTDIQCAHHFKSLHEEKYISGSRLIHSFASKLVRLFGDIKDRTVNIRTIKLLNSDVFNQLVIGTTITYMDGHQYAEWINPTTVESQNRKTLEAKNIRGEKISLLGTNPEQETGIERLNAGTSCHFNDPSQIIFIYNIAQYAASKLTRAFRIFHLDNNPHILNNLQRFYKNSPYFLPKSCSLYAVEWQNTDGFVPTESQERFFCYGQGAINRSFQEDIRNLALQMIAQKKQAENIQRFNNEYLEILTNKFKEMYQRRHAMMYSPNVHTSSSKIVQESNATATNIPAAITVKSKAVKSTTETTPPAPPRKNQLSRATFKTFFSPPKSNNGETPAGLVRPISNAPVSAEPSKYPFIQPTPIASVKKALRSLSKLKTSHCQMMKTETASQKNG